MHNDRRPANNNTPLLTLERAIADNISPKQLRDVAAANDHSTERRRKVANHLRKLADKLELLGYGRAA